MAKFLLSISYPPAQKRAYTNVLSEKAEEGFELFHIKGDNDPSRQRPNICGNCHRMPFLGQHEYARIWYGYSYLERCKR